MRLIPVCVLGVFLASLMGCSLLGYHIYKKAPRPLPEEVARIRFPDSFEGSTSLSGAMMKAVSVAMNDFIPPGTNPEEEEDLVARCLAQWETFTISVIQPEEEGIFFVRFSPEKLPECAPGRLVLDGGAVYAIDGQGHILAVQE